ncbi:putative hydrophobins [Lyophyllum shimeji]|uniref:Hydrophobin n=1 Tax=Lyophyllum shimeji TaxID=47721 RepID=A0A9P3PQE1_LYOSH|nr:putative hydrophobins [Lyophyllum shimeji]
MKFSTAFAVVAAALSLGVVNAETNAERLSRGLPPLPPVRRATPVGAARRGTPSGTPGGQCNTGPVQCCNSVTHSSDPVASLLLGLLGVAGLGSNVLVGITCSPLSVIGAGGNSCTSQPVCCSNNSFNGIIALGCSPINLNL